MDGVADGSRYSHIRRSCWRECDHGCYYSLHDETAKSADAECSHPACKCNDIARLNALRGLVGHAVQIILL